MQTHPGSVGLANQEDDKNVGRRTHRISDSDTEMSRRRQRADLVQCRKGSVARNLFAGFDGEVR